MDIRKIKCEEKSFILDFVYNIFKETDYSDGLLEVALVKEIRASENYIEDLEIVALENDKIFAHAMFSKFYIGGKELLLLAPICVDTRRQRIGIGKSTLKYGLEIAKNMGFKGIIVLGEPEFYKTLGFKPAKSFNISLKDNNIPSSYLMAIELYESALAEISGEVDYSVYKSLSSFEG